jgi:hypothetical protein
MKKTLLILTFVFAAIFANAQCTPDPQFTAAGIYPDTSIGLAPAYVGQSYNENITIITPTDTVVDVLGSMVAVTIDSINLTSVTGLPSGFSYSCDPPSCGFPGGTSKCAELYSTINPTASDIGVYNIIFETTAYASDVPFLGTMTQDDAIDYYYIEISVATSTINQFDNFTLELKDIFPNPVNDQSKIQFITGEPKDVVFSVFNYLGEKMDEQIIAANRGVNDIFINANNYPNGMYLYSINNGEKIISKRMVIAN